MSGLARALALLLVLAAMTSCKEAAEKPATTGLAIASAALFAFVAFIVAVILLDPEKRLRELKSEIQQLSGRCNRYEAGMRAGDDLVRMFGAARPPPAQANGNSVRIKLSNPDPQTLSRIPKQCIKDNGDGTVSLEIELPERTS